MSQLFKSAKEYSPYSVVKRGENTVEIIYKGPISGEVFPILVAKPHEEGSDVNDLVSTFEFWIPILNGAWRHGAASYEHSLVLEEAMKQPAGNA